MSKFNLQVDPPLSKASTLIPLPSRVNPTVPCTILGSSGRPKLMSATIQFEGHRDAVGNTIEWFNYY